MKKFNEKPPLAFFPMKIPKHYQNSEAQYVDSKLINRLQCRFSMNSDINHIALRTIELINVTNH